MRPILRNASPRKPLPKRQATGRPWTERIDIMCWLLRVFGAVSSVRDAEQGKGSPTMDLPNPTSAFPLVASFATKLRAQSVRGGIAYVFEGRVGGDTLHRGKMPTLRGSYEASGLGQLPK